MLGSPLASGDATDAAPTVVDPPTVEAADRDAAQRRVQWAAVALVLVPLVVSAVDITVRFRHYVSVGDVSMTEMLTRDVGRYAVEVGPYSRDGWFHPGPLLFYVLAVPYRLLGSATSALVVGALLVSGASVAGMALIARRRGGPVPALLTLVACALLIRSLGPDEVRLPWNPYITVLPFGLLVFLTWAQVDGDRWALPVAAFTASFVAQTHVGYAPMSVLLLLVGAAGLLVAAVRSGRTQSGRGPRSLVAPSLAALGVLALAWLPPVVDQLRGGGGNLRRIEAWFRSGGADHEPARGLQAGWRAVTGQYGWPPEWLFGERGVGLTTEPIELHEPVVPVLLLGVAAIAAVAWRRRARAAGSLLVVWLIATLGGIVATSRTVGLIFDYRMGWASVLGMVAGVAAAWVGWSAARDRRPWLEPRVFVPACLVALAVLAVVSSVAHVGAGRPQPDTGPRLDAVVPDVIAGLPEGDGRVVVDGDTGFYALAYAPSLVLQLERRGIDARTAGSVPVAGAHRVDSGDGPERARLVVATGETIALVAADPTRRLLAYDGGGVALDEVLDPPDGAAPPDPRTTLAIFAAE